MNLKRLGYLFFLIVPLIANGYSAFEAKDHIGEKATVCGRVVSTYYARSSHGEPTFLNLEKPYPNQIFTVVIWGDDRENFDRPEEKYGGKKVCVKGRIKSYRGVAEMVIYSPRQIEVQ